MLFSIIFVYSLAEIPSGTEPLYSMFNLVFPVICRVRSVAPLATAHLILTRMRKLRICTTISNCGYLRLTGDTWSINANYPNYTPIAAAAHRNFEAAVRDGRPLATQEHAAGG